MDVGLLALGVVLVLLAAARRRPVDRDGAAGYGPARVPRGHRRAGRQHHGHDDLGRQRELDAHRAAAVRLDGRDPVPQPAVGVDVPRPRALARPAPGPPAARQRRGLRHLRGRLRLVRGDDGHHRPHLAARARQARLRSEDEHGRAHRRGHARHHDPAVDHVHRLRRGGRSVDRAPVRGRHPSRLAAHGAVHGLHRGLGAAQPGQDAARRIRRWPSSRSCAAAGT